MMIATVIGIWILQIVLSVFLDAKGLRLWKHAVIALILVLYIFVIPPLFYPDFLPGSPTCGMHDLGIFMFFLIIGGGLTIVTHFVYLLIGKNKRNKVTKKM